MGDLITERLRRTVKKGTRTEVPAKIGHRSIKYVEPYGTLASLGAGLSAKIIDWEIPDGYAAELFALGITPYMLGSTEESRDVEIGFDSKLTGIKFLVSNLLRLNAIPWGDGTQPIRLLDYPMRRGNLTVKFNEGMKIQMVITAGAVAIAHDAYARMKVLLYEEADAKAIHGVGISNFATLPGGVSQALPQQIFAEYAIPSTTGKGVFENAYTKGVKAYEQIRLSHVGVGIFTGTHPEQLKIRDLRTKTEFPEYEPFWRVTPTVNALPFGDGVQPMAKLPSVVGSHVYTNTTIEVKLKDDGAAVATNDVGMQLLGTYRRIR